MEYVDLTIRYPDELLHPMQRFIRFGDAVDYEEMVMWSVRPSDGRHVALYYVKAHLERYRRAVDGLADTIECRIAALDDRRAYVWVVEELRAADQAISSTFVGRRLLVLPPIRIDADAAMGMTIVGGNRALQAAIDDLPDTVDVTINAVGPFDRHRGTLAGPLTDRQRAAVAAAVELGYYEVPRTADLATVAAAIDCAESTASVLLRRAERDIMTQVIDRYAGRTDR